MGSEGSLQFVSSAPFALGIGWCVPWSREEGCRGPLDPYFHLHVKHSVCGLGWGLNLHVILVKAELF